MATKKQSFEQPQENAASKAAQGRKQPGGSTSPGQSTPANQGQSNQSTQPNQGATGQQNTGAGQNAAPGQNTPQSGTAQGATGQSGQGNQGATGAGQRGSAQGQSAGGDQDLLQHAKQATGEIVNQVQQQAGSQIARQKESAATDLNQVVQAVRRFGESLGQEQGGPIARYAAEYGDKAAQSLERFSSYIREQDPKQLLNDVQNFGRRQPALLLGGAFLLGLAGARLIKSSMSMNAQSYQADVTKRPSPNPNAL